MGETPSFRVSPQQEQLWLAEPDGPTGGIVAVVELEGTVDPAALQAALEQLVERHEILRTTFVRQAGIRIPLQAIHDSLPPAWRAGDGEAAAPDLEHGPLVRATFASSGNGTHTLSLALPSLIADELSVGVLLDELVALFGAQPVADEPLQYADFSEWQHEQLEDAAEAPELPTPRIPLARAASEGPSELRAVAVPVDAAAVADVAGRYSASAAALVQAAWHAFLARTTAADDLAVATLNATPRHPDLEGAVGLIARPLPIRTSVPSDLTFAELLDQLTRELADVGGREHALPFGAAAGAPAFVVRRGFAAEQAGVRFQLTRLDVTGSGSPLALVFEDGDELRLALAYDSAAIAPEHAELLAGQFARLLASALADPGAALGNLELLGDDERHLLLDEVNDTAVEVPAGRVHELFAKRAAETPDAVAVTDGSDSISYAALDARANQLARRLQSGGVSPGDVVALCTDRSVEMVVGVLGILKAGGAYLPLNQEHPVARLRHQVEESNARALVTQETLLERLPDVTDVVCLDRDRAELDALEGGAPEAGGTADDPVYVIYTSGSTGTPKGVEVTHANVANYVHDMVARLGAEGRAFSFGMVTAISTDLGNTAFYPALCSGGTLALVRPETAGDPSAFAQRFESAPLDVLKITPSHLNALLRADDARVLPREWLIVGGERLGWDLVEKVRALGSCRILNHYGPTETTIGSCTNLVEGGAGPYRPASVPIGRPISNTRCYVLDDRSQPVPLDVPGRLFIGGAGVARGYIGQPELTAERFLSDPFAGSGARMYDTGDLARRLPDGSLEFLGRVDEQVKIRGFRVEPSEVESALRSHDGVANAAVVAVEETPGDIRLVAYCEAPGGTSTDELRRHVAEWVPEYMVPSAFVVLDELPLTPSGKVDRQALPELGEAASSGDASYVAPRTALEEAVAAIWADVLGRERVGVEDDFFALGGHSLLATQVVAQVRTDFAIELPLHSLFMSPTVALLSAEIVGMMGEAESEETAKLLEELEGLTDEEASQLVSELGGPEGA